MLQIFERVRQIVGPLEPGVPLDARQRFEAGADRVQYLFLRFWSVERVSLRGKFVNRQSAGFPLLDLAVADHPLQLAVDVFEPGVGVRSDRRAGPVALPDGLSDFFVERYSESVHSIFRRLLVFKTGRAEGQFPPPGLP